jgi:protein tyrosine phosphatase
MCPAVNENETTVGNKTCNNKKNRFPHIVPCKPCLSVLSNEICFYRFIYHKHLLINTVDKTRVVLQVDTNKEEEEGANYINASYAKVNMYTFLLNLTPCNPQLKKDSLQT